jgi:hypothetical protein
MSISIQICLVFILVANHSGRLVKGINFLRPSTIGVVGSNPTRGMDICVRLFYFCVVLRVGSGLTTA